MQITEKQQEILFKLIELHIQNAEPVGSRTLSKMTDVDISPAGLRNIMVDLSELSMVEQPHTSAGRVPTDYGYRMYVDQLMSMIDFNERNPALEEKFNLINDDLDNLLRGTSELLAEESRMMSIVMSPRPVKSRMKKIEFIPLSGDRVLTVLVTCAGMISHKLIHTREKLSSGLLGDLSDYLNGNFSSKPLSEVRETLLESLNYKMGKKPKEFARALRLSKKAFDLAVTGQIYKNGQNYFLNCPEFNSIENFSTLFQALDSHENLTNLLERDLESHRVVTYIGSEHSVEDLESCSIIIAHYRLRNDNLGSLAILGPKRLDYGKVIPLLDQAASLLSERLKRISQWVE